MHVVLHLYILRGEQRYEPTGGDMIQRYSFTALKEISPGVFDTGFKEDVDGDIVLYPDYLAALEEKDRRIADLQTETARLYSLTIEKDKEIAALKDELAKLRAFWDQSRLADKQTFETYDWRQKP